MEPSVYQTTSCDVLVIGGGGAGIRAALAAAERGQQVILISETPIGDSGSTFYPLSFEWGMLSATDAEDARAFQQEILAAAKGCVNAKLVSYLANGSKEARDQFISEGLPLTPMRSMRITGCFGKEPRGDFLNDMDTFIQSQQRLIRENEQITVLQGTAVSLLTKERQCAGCMAVNAEGRLLQLNAKAVVMAAGGGEGLYQHRASYGALYGNAYAMAARKEARIVNLEFIQFVPGTVAPIQYLNYFPFLLGEHPKVTNAQDEECMSRYLPVGKTTEQVLDAHAKHGPFTCEDDGKYLEYAMIGEEAAGRGMGIKLWPDPGRMQDERGIHWRHFLHRMGFDEGTVMQIYPMAQGFNGGILLHDDLTTDLPGLFACGESSGGLHGPDRMGGLCILATQVFGKGAGLAAADYARQRQEQFLAEEEAIRQFETEFDGSEEATASPDEILQQIRTIMQENACLRRNEQGLRKGLRQLEQMHLKPLHSLNTPHAPAHFRVSNAIVSARLILTAMLCRRESRGSHDRSDYPQHDPALTAMQWVSLEKNHVIQGIVT